MHQELLPETFATRVRVFVVDDDQLRVWAFKQFFESAACGIEFVGAAADGGDALRLVRQSQPDVILVALDLGPSSLDLIPKLSKLAELHVLAIAGASSNATCDRAILDGARGLLRRNDPVESIVKAVRRVHAGELWLDRIATGRIFSTLARKGSPNPDAEKIAALTRRERKIIATLGSMSCARHRKIATQLNVSEHTLRNHLSSIYAKLGLAGHFELYLYAQQHGLAQAGSL